MLHPPALPSPPVGHAPSPPVVHPPALPRCMALTLSPSHAAPPQPLPNLCGHAPQPCGAPPALPSCTALTPEPSHAALPSPLPSPPVMHFPQPSLCVLHVLGGQEESPRGSEPVCMAPSKPQSAPKDAVVSQVGPGSPLAEQGRVRPAGWWSPCQGQSGLQAAVTLSGGSGLQAVVTWPGDSCGLQPPGCRPLWRVSLQAEVTPSGEAQACRLRSPGPRHPGGRDSPCAWRAGARRCSGATR